MNIIWNENPLLTVVELNDMEKELFRLKIRLEEYEDMIFSAHWSLTRDAEYLASLPRPTTIDQARAEAVSRLNPDYWCSDDRTKMDNRIDELLEHYLEELKSAHVGDCTCVPCSCSKCHAEGLLGIDTIKGAGKSMLYHIDAAFGHHNERSLDQAIEHLENYDPVFTGAGGWTSKESFDQYVPRWKTEAARALAWLKNYKDEHFTAASPGGISRQIAFCNEAATTGDAGASSDSN